MADFQQSTLFGVLFCFVCLSLALLFQLWLGENVVTGTLPSSLGSLSQILKLDLAWNRLTGSIPPSIGSLMALTRINLADNSLGGMLEQLCI